ncbi:MAG: Selenocysteine-specific translation elongation factor [uncultured Solirubrobacterales bacterium]|uniref:Selenocysteine-specific elongation factor n=1 Tax=uncultured Solirubrobacterales bacterium TaxID=768556 RepID=A0A6J4RV43_9ACTN|nr:MAG: Selenocysteine-specific translation elongation factor [uncultured Solirubrobacterales bacterium]
MSADPLTLGTAGHIDHGKSALIAALTGRDTDRLPEERKRGISIELGYARLELPSGRALSVVDVPGHERFVRTMVAGATGIDLYLLCVAADDGVMPQTREHLAVLRGLGVERGVVAVTKADIGEPELVAEEIAELLPGVEVVAVSALRRTGLDELLATLDRVAAELPGRAATRQDEAPRLHVDRSFTLRGIGTVVTGTLWAGRLAAGDSVRVLPRGLETRVRSVQIHDRPVQSAGAGQRVALNLAGVGWRELERGDVLSAAGAGLEPTHHLDARISFAARAGRPLERGTRVQVHHGTREAPGRVYPLEGETVAPGTSALVQLRLESPLVPAAGDRLIVRQIAPPDTLGGGVVLDPRPRRHGRSETILRRLAAFERGEALPEEPRGNGAAPPSGAASPPPEPPPLDDAARRLAEILHADGERPRADAELAEAAGLDPSTAHSRLSDLVRAGEAVRVARNLHFAPDPLARLESSIVALCERDGQATIAGVRDELATSRRYAQALLEHLDAEKVTRRQGDAHVLRRRS